MLKYKIVIGILTLMQNFPKLTQFCCRSIEDNVGVEILGRTASDNINDDEDEIIDETDRFN